MKVKTYKTQSLHEGLEDIKRDLGGDALILSTRSVPASVPFRLFRKPTWEITAAFEEKAEPESETLAPHVKGRRPSLKREAAPVLREAGSRGARARQSESFVDEELAWRREALIDEPLTREARARQGEALMEEPRARQNEAFISDRVRVSNRASTAAAAVAPARVTPNDPRMDDLIGEISDLKKSFRSLSKAIPAKSQLGGVYAELIHQGIDYDFADRLVTTASRGNPAPSELRNRIRRLLADHLLVAPPAELHAKARMVSAFVGPTGVGKTTTIAKIAGHASVRMKKKVALISTDISRIGGQEQLSRFGELLGIPTYGCVDITMLKDLVASLDDRHLILIDTPGSSPSDLSRLSKLENVTSAADAKVHLVISATTRSEDITKIVSRFQRFSPTSVIFTKVDETDSKGSLAGDLLRNELPVSYLTNGQRVPEDLLMPGADELARYVLPLEPAI